MNSAILSSNDPLVEGSEIKEGMKLCKDLLGLDDTAGQSNLADDDIIAL